MPTDHVRLTLQKALLQLAQDAHHMAGTLPAHGTEHDFHVGVAAAAQDRLHPEARREKEGLFRESQAFRDGYTKTALMIAHHSSARTAHTPQAPAPPVGTRPAAGVQ
jgi:hypothetical protein